MTTLSTRKRGKRTSTWYYSFDAGHTPDGKRKRVEKGGFATEAEAKAEGIKALASYLNGNIAITSEKISVKDFLAEWIDRKKLEVRPKTLALYRAIVARVLPFIGGKYVQKLRPRDVDDMICQLAGKGLAHSTLSVTLTVLKDALAYAVYPSEIISANPAQYIKIPKKAPKKNRGKNHHPGGQAKRADRSLPIRA